MPQPVKEARIDPVESEVLEKTSALQEIRIFPEAPERGLLKSAEYLKTGRCIELDN